jgi:hypothetical protein
MSRLTKAMGQMEQDGRAAVSLLKTLAGYLDFRGDSELVESLLSLAKLIEDPLNELVESYDEHCENEHNS